MHVESSTVCAHIAKWQYTLNQHSQFIVAIQVETRIAHPYWPCWGEEVSVYVHITSLKYTPNQALSAYTFLSGNARQISTASSKMQSKPKQGFCTHVGLVGVRKQVIVYTLRHCNACQIKHCLRTYFQVAIHAESALPVHNREVQVELDMSNRWDWWRCRSAITNK